MDEFSTFYIELDCLFDTRLATLYSFGEDVMKNVLGETYYTREQDVFPGVDPEEFKRRYQSRTKAILKDAITTPMIEMIQEFTLETLHQIVNSPFHHLPKITLNTYPYELTEEECQVISEIIVSKTKGRADVECIHKSPAELTPVYVKQNFGIMVMYDYPVWLEHHSRTGDFTRVTCPEVTVLAPKLYFNGLPSSADMAQAKSINMTPFEAMETFVGPLVGLKLLPIEYFSLVLKLKRV